MPNALVRKLARLASLSADDEDKLVQATRMSRDVPAHRDLIRDGERPGPAYFVLEGWACRYKTLAEGDRQITAFLLPGDFCDVDPDLLDQMDHSIGTLVACRIASITQAKVSALIVASPNLTKAFWRAHLVDEGVLRGWIVNMGQRDSLERIAHLMLELFVRMRNVGLTTEHGCNMPLTQTVLADALGLTPVHVNRVLRTLAERGVMQLRSGLLTVTNVAELMRIAGFDCDYLHQRINRPVAVAG